MDIDKVCVGPSKKTLNAGIDKLCNGGVVMRKVREVRVSEHEKRKYKNKMFWAISGGQLRVLFRDDYVDDVSSFSFFYSIFIS